MKGLPPSSKSVEPTELTSEEFLPSFLINVQNTFSKICHHEKLLQTRVHVANATKFFNPVNPAESVVQFPVAYHEAVIAFALAPAALFSRTSAATLFLSDLTFVFILER